MLACIVRNSEKWLRPTEVDVLWYAMVCAMLPSSAVCGVRMSVLFFVRDVNGSAAVSRLLGASFDQQCGDVSSQCSTAWQVDLVALPSTCSV